MNATGPRTPERRQKRLSLIYVRSSHLVVGPNIMGRMIVPTRRGPESITNVFMSHNWGFGLAWLLFVSAGSELVEFNGNGVGAGIARFAFVAFRLLLLVENGDGNSMIFMPRKD